MIGVNDTLTVKAKTLARSVATTFIGGIVFGFGLFTGAWLAFVVLSWLMDLTL